MGIAGAGWFHDTTSEYAIHFPGALFLHLVPGNGNGVFVARSLGGGRCGAARGEGNGLSNGGDHHVPPVTHLVSRTSGKV